MCYCKLKVARYTWQPLLEGEKERDRERVGENMIERHATGERRVGKHCTRVVFNTEIIPPLLYL